MWHRHYTIVETLLKAGAQVNPLGYKGVTPLHDAVKLGCLKVSVFSVACCASTEDYFVNYSLNFYWIVNLDYRFALEAWCRPTFEKCEQRSCCRHHRRHECAGTTEKISTYYQ